MIFRSVARVVVEMQSEQHVTGGRKKPELPEESQ